MSDNSAISLAQLTAHIVAAYVENNSVPIAALPELIRSVSSSISGLGSQPAEEPAAAPVPAVNPKRSVHSDHIVCLEDGKKFKSLKRHLMTHHQMTPQEYRAKWNLPSDYPMVAPNYAEARSSLAKSMGLGRKPEPEPVKAPEPPAKPKRTRKAKAAA
ncbi:MAG: MucR family transcriptional regulator [Rhizobiaceae bacterium]